MVNYAITDLEQSKSGLGKVQVQTSTKKAILVLVQSKIGHDARRDKNIQVQIRGHKDTEIFVLEYKEVQVQTVSESQSTSTYISQNYFVLFRALVQIHKTEKKLV